LGENHVPCAREKRVIADVRNRGDIAFDHQGSRLSLDLSQLILQSTDAARFIVRRRDYLDRFRLRADGFRVASLAQKLREIRRCESTLENVLAETTKHAFFVDVPRFASTFAIALSRPRLDDPCANEPCMPKYAECAIIGRGRACARRGAVYSNYGTTLLENLTKGRRGAGIAYGKPAWPRRKVL